MPKKKDLTNQKFGRLTVIRPAPRGRTKSGNSYTQWYCNCDCGMKDIIIRTSSLINGDTRSCGCLYKERCQIWSKKFNSYLFSKDYCVGFTEDKEHYFIIDKNNYEKIKDYYWGLDKDGYIVSHMGKESKTPLHRFLTDCPRDKVVDHINHNKFDNRQINLRICAQQENSFNKQYYYEDSEAPIGVTWDERTKKWVARVYLNKQNHHLGYFDTKEEAIKARDIGAKKYYKEFSYDKNADTIDLIDILPDVDYSNMSIEKLGNLLGYTGGSYGYMIYNPNGLCPTLNSMEGGGRQPMIVEDVYSCAMRGRYNEDGTTSQHLEINNNFTSNCITNVEKDSMILEKQKDDNIKHRIRKLTPKECYRLMGMTDEDYEKAAEVNSATQLYKQAGNSICVNVLVAIFGQMFEGHEDDYKKFANTIQY